MRRRVGEVSGTGAAPEELLAVTNPLRDLAAASDELDLRWVTVVGPSGQCSCELGVWSVAGQGEPSFTSTAWQWSPQEMLGAMYGRFLLETAMELEGEAG